MVDASFMQTLWNMNPVCSGCELAEGKIASGGLINGYETSSFISSPF